MEIVIGWHHILVIISAMAVSSFLYGVIAMHMLKAILTPLPEEPQRDLSEAEWQYKSCAQCGFAPSDNFEQDERTRCRQ